MRVFQLIYLQMRCSASHLRGCITVFQKRWVTGRMKQGALQEGCLNATLKLTGFTSHLMQRLSNARTNDSPHTTKQYGPAKIVLRSLQVREPSRTACATVQVFNPYQILQFCFCSFLASCHLRCQKLISKRPENLTPGGLVREASCTQPPMIIIFSCGHVQIV